MGLAAFQDYLVHCAPCAFVALYSFWSTFIDACSGAEFVFCFLFIFLWKQDRWKFLLVLLFVPEAMGSQLALIVVAEMVRLEA